MSNIISANGGLNVPALMVEVAAELGIAVAVAEVYPAPTSDRPSDEEIEAGMWDGGGCEATDGCWVEPDGICPHKHPSWLRYEGLI